jgi:TRAP-type transport system periplasmic protein
MEIQGLPFAFTSSEQVYRAMDGELGAHLGKELAAKGIHCFARGLMENGFRHISTLDRPIESADDLVGVRMRIPGGRIFADLFESLGAVPVVVNIAELYDALKTRRVQGQENPLVVTEVNRLYEVTRYVAITNHMWSGFNMLANRRFWVGLPTDVQAIIELNVATHVARQRDYTRRLNRELPSRLAQRGLVFNTAESDSFRRRLGAGFYRRWKAELGTTAWRLLEAEVGALT